MHYFYAQVKELDEIYDSDDLIIMEFGYHYDDYFKLFTSLDNVIYLTSETSGSLDAKEKGALENGKRVYTHPHVEDITPRVK